MYGDFSFRVGQRVQFLDGYSNPGVWYVQSIGYVGTIVVCRVSQGDSYLNVSQACLTTAEP